jgi:hypothetical protein
VYYSTKGTGRKGGSDSEFVTPAAASRKKRKLFSNTPQHSQVQLGSVLQCRIRIQTQVLSFILPKIERLPKSRRKNQLFNP